MDIPKVTNRDWVYIGGAVASIVALAAFVIIQKRSNVSVSTPTTSDIPNPGTPVGNTPNYINYNTGYYNAPPIQTGSDLSPNTEGTSACGCNMDCAGPSPLATNQGTYSSLTSLLTYYQNTNPVYLQMVQAQTQRYAAYFAAGETYSHGGTPIGVSAG